MEFLRRGPSAACPSDTNHRPARPVELFAPSGARRYDASITAPECKSTGGYADFSGLFRSIYTSASIAPTFTSAGLRRNGIPPLWAFGRPSFGRIPFRTAFLTRCAKLREVDPELYLTDSAEPYRFGSEVALYGARRQASGHRSSIRASIW